MFSYHRRIWQNFRCLSSLSQHFCVANLTSTSSVSWNSGIVSAAFSLRFANGLNLFCFASDSHVRMVLSHAPLTYQPNSSTYLSNAHDTLQRWCTVAVGASQCSAFKTGTHRQLHGGEALPQATNRIIVPLIFHDGMRFLQVIKADDAVHASQKQPLVDIVHVHLQARVP